MVDTPDNNHTAAGPAGGPTAAGGDAAGGADGSNGSEAAPQEVQEPTFKQLLRVGVTKGLPFVAFGFFDNIIMVSVQCCRLLAGVFVCVLCCPEAACFQVYLFHTHPSKAAFDRPS